MQTHEDNLTDKLDWNQAEYETYVTSDEYKRSLRKKLGENHRKMKVIQQENLSMFKAMADPGKSEKMYELVNTAHLGTLNYLGEDVVDAIKESIPDCDDLDFFLKHRNEKFYKSADVLDAHMDHPVQKKLMKEKHLTRREMKKQKSAFNHLKCLFKAKLDSKISDDVKNLQKEVEILRTQQSVIAVQQQLLVSDVEDVMVKLTTVEAQLKDVRKTELQNMVNSGVQHSVKDLAQMLGVSRVTVYKWLKELKV